MYYGAYYRFSFLFSLNQDCNQGFQCGNMGTHALLVYLFIRLTIILKLNTFVRDSSPNQIVSPLSRRSSHTTQSEHQQTTAMGSRLLCDALFTPQHHSHKLVIYLYIYFFGRFQNKSLTFLLHTWLFSL
jgi:hypothetical protein